MFDIMVLFGFMLIMFGTIATQLFGGILENRCFAKAHKYPYGWTHLIGKEKQEYFCMTDADCVDRRPPEITSTECRKFENPIA
jgi:hypothetical protein